MSRRPFLKIEPLIIAVTSFAHLMALSVNQVHCCSLAEGSYQAKWPSIFAEDPGFDLIPHGLGRVHECRAHIVRGQRCLVALFRSSVDPIPDDFGCFILRDRFEQNKLWE